MFEKHKLRKEIEKSKKNIEMLEQKRTRSQAALVEAILRHTDPDDKDVDFFNQFTDQIEAERGRMHNLMSQLEQLSAKKK